MTELGRDPGLDEGEIVPRGTDGEVVRVSDPFPTEAEHEYACICRPTHREYCASIYCVGGSDLSDSA